jgi:hypothetical protein
VHAQQACLLLQAATHCLDVAPCHLSSCGQVVDAVLAAHASGELMTALKGGHEGYKVGRVLKVADEHSWMQPC